MYQNGLNEEDIDDAINAVAEEIEIEAEEFTSPFDEDEIPEETVSRSVHCREIYATKPSLAERLQRD